MTFLRKLGLHLIWGTFLCQKRLGVWRVVYFSPGCYTSSSLVLTWVLKTCCFLHNARYLASSIGVILLHLSAYVDTQLQPIFVPIFRQVGGYRDRVVNRWLSLSHSKAFELEEEILGRQAATVWTVLARLTKTGIWPVDRQTIGEGDFSTVEVLRGPEHFD